MRTSVRLDILRVPRWPRHLTSSTNCCAPARPRATRARPQPSGARKLLRRALADGLGSSIARRRRERAPARRRRPHRRDRPRRHPHRREGLPLVRPDRRLGPQILVGQRVEVRGQGRARPGVVGRKPIHLLDPEQRKKVVELEGPPHRPRRRRPRRGRRAGPCRRPGRHRRRARPPRRRPAGFALDGQPPRRLRRAGGPASLP